MSSVQELSYFESGQPFDGSLSDSAQTDNADCTASNILTEDFVKTYFPFTTEMKN